MKQCKLTLSVVALSCSLTLIGCQSTSNSNQNIGMATGAVLGGLLGSQIGSGSGRTIAIASGALLGGWIGGEIGASLSNTEQHALNQTTGQALDTVPDNQTVQWKSRETDSTINMTPSNTQSKSRNSTLVKLKNIQAPPKLALINQVYVAKKNANVRSGASTKYPLVGGLSAGETFHAVGSVIGSPWIVVAKNNVTLGYVHKDLVTAHSRLTASQTSQDGSPNAPIREQLNVTDLDQVQIAAVDLDDIELGGEPVRGDIEVQEVALESKCRTMTYEMEQSREQAKTESFEVCEATDGAWEII